MLDPELVRRRLRQVDLVLGVSDFVTDRIRQRFPEFASCCRTLYNGVDADFFRPDDLTPHEDRAGGPRVTYVGRVSPEKGVHVLLDAFERVSRECPGATLDIIGPANSGSLPFLDPGREEPHLRPLYPFFRDRDSYLPYLKAKVARGEAGPVRFLGHVRHDELPGHYRQSDVFVIPSVIHEPFGIPLAEAMACGLPAVATSGGGFPEVVRDGATGLLVPRGDAQALAEAIIGLLRDRPRRVAMGDAARRRALGNFSWEAVLPELERHYAALLEPPARCGGPDVPPRGVRFEEPREVLQP
jgi:glycosyltransferase involved in cell wall biosynthesis